MPGESLSRISHFSPDGLRRLLVPRFERTDERGVPFRAKRALAIVLVLVLACIMVAPWTIPPGSAVDLDGTVGVIDHPDLWEGMNPFARAVYWLGDLQCHQMIDRSYSMNGNQIPVCARDLGIVAGMAAAMVASTRLRVGISPLHLLLGLLPMGLDGGMQLLTDHESWNALRLLTGGIAGAAVAMFMAMVFQETLSRGEKGETGRHRRS